MMFEQELYNNFNVYFPKPYFITFAGDVSNIFIYLAMFSPCECLCVSVKSVCYNVASTVL